MTISELKKDAKSRLSGKLGKAVGINVIYFIISFILQLIGNKIETDSLKSVYLIIVAIITLPLSYGILASMIKLSRGENVTVTDFITIGLQNTAKIYGVFGRTLQKLILPLILFIASIVVYTFAVASAVLNSGSSSILVIALVLMIGTLIYYIVKTLSYILTSYVLYDNENSTCKEIVEKSAVLMKGNKWKYIGLCLSFIGWYLLIYIIAIFTATACVSILSSSTLGVLLGTVLTVAFTSIAVLLLTPYISFTLISFYEDLNSVSETTVADEPIIE